MPVKHVRDIPAVSYTSWYTLTDAEREALVAAVTEVNETSDIEVVPDTENISLSDGVGPGSVPGTNIRVPVTVDTKGLPEDLTGALKEAVRDADIASLITNCRKLPGPYTVGHDGQEKYRTVVIISGSWNAHETVQH